MVQGGDAKARGVISRRTVVGGSVGAAAVAFAYAAFGDQLLSNTNEKPLAASSPTATPDAVRLAGAEVSALDTESARISHLLRRAGFGLTRDEYDRYQAMGLDATIDELVHYGSVDDAAAVAEASRFAESDNPGAGVDWWLSLILNTKRPLQEKLTFFWHGVLTSQISVVKDPAAMISQNELLRTHAKGPFPDLLRAISADPAMMVYLDIAGSSKESPNENYARELMELFALGEGNFTENDVREASRAFTGWRVPRQRNDNGRPSLLEPVFQPQRFDDGVKTVLGQTGNFGPDDIVDIIVQEPASVAYITGRLFSYFVYPDPDPADLQPFIDVYLASGFNIGATVEAMLRSEVFYSPRSYRAFVKSPVEYGVAALKALNLQDTSPSTLTGNLRQGGGVLSEMGQIPMEPPNVAGWPGGASWLNSATLFARLNFIDRLTSGGMSDAGPQASGQANLGTAAQALDYYLPLLMDDNVPESARQVLFDYVGGADALVTPEQLRDLVYIMLASPQFHLA